MVNNLTIHKDSQGRGAAPVTQFGVNVPFSKASTPAHLWWWALSTRIRWENVLSNMRLELTKGVKIAAIYFIISGGIGALWPLTGLGPHHPEFQATSFAWKLGSYAREILISILFLISGIGLLYKKIWARKMAMVILVISTIYSANSSAWGFAQGEPTLSIRAISFLIVGLWNGFWFYLVYKSKPQIIQNNIG